MKNKGHTNLVVILAIAAIGIVLAAQPAKAVSPVGYTINLIELTSISLTATYNGPGATFSVLPNTIPDQWTVTATLTQGSTFTFNPSFTIDWIEPEQPTEFNEVSHGVAFGNNLGNLYVTSDESILEYAGDFTTINPNGALVAVGTDNGQTVFLRFDDQAAMSESSSVPDAGSSLGLAALSAAALFGLSRLRFLRFA